MTDQEQDVAAVHDEVVGKPLHAQLNAETTAWAIKEKVCDCGKMKIVSVHLVEDRFMLRDKSAPDPLYLSLGKGQTWVRVKISEIPDSEIAPQRSL